MNSTYTVTESGIPHAIPLDGPTVFAFADGQVLIQYWAGKPGTFHPISPDQSFLEIVRLRQQAREVALLLPV